MTDLDELMSLDPLSLSVIEGTEGRRNLDEIISYHRANRAKEGPDGKMPRGRKAAPSKEKAKMSLEELLGGLMAKKPAPPSAPTTPTKPSTGPRRI